MDRNNYLIELCRYIVLNPVRGGLVAAPAEYVWSSYAATCGDAPAPPWLTTDWVLSQFASRRADARRRYREFVREGIGGDSPWDQLQGQVLLGDREFVEGLAPMLEPIRDGAEVPIAQRHAHRPALAELLTPVVTADHARRDRAVREAHIRHGYLLSEIARHTGMHYTTVSRIVNRRVPRNGA